MRCFRFAARLNGVNGFIYAGGYTPDEARKRASKLTKNIQGGERAGYFKEGCAPRFARG